MSVLALLFDAARRLPASAPTPLVLIRRCISWPIEEIAYQQAYFAVRRLSPHMIADLGLDPNDLPASFRQKWHAPESEQSDFPPEPGTAVADTSLRVRHMPDSNPVVMAERTDVCACP